MKVLREMGVAFASLLGTAISVNAAQVNNLPPERVTGVASYVSGGVSDGEVERFQAAFKQYPLIVELYEHSGARDEYTADAQVRITDRKGATVLEQRADGPFMKSASGRAAAIMFASTHQRAKSAMRRSFSAS